MGAGEPYGQGPLVKVAWAENQAEAELIAGLLRSEGIPSVIKRGIGVDVPDMIAAGPRDILVAASGANVARALLVPEDGIPGAERALGARPLWVRLLAAAIAAALLLSCLGVLVRGLVGIL